MQSIPQTSQTVKSKVVIDRQNTIGLSDQELPQMMIVARQGRTIITTWKSQSAITNQELKLLAYIAGGWDRITTRLDQTNRRLADVNRT